MKGNLKLALIIIFILFFRFIHSQNFVPNPSFENYTVCPTINNNITDCSNWKNFGQSPDYYNGCSVSGLNVPNAQFGYQNAHLGVGMAALITWLNPVGSSGPNYREFIGCALTTTLQVGIKYYMSFYVNYSGYPNNTVQTQVAANKIGLRFSTVASSTSVPSPINNFAHLSTLIIYKDTVNWLKISGSFMADSNYRYVVIGNFHNDANTDTSSLGGGQLLGNVGSYYYIDDVCVTNDSLFNANWTTEINESINLINNLMYPNPTSKFIHFKALKSEHSLIEIYNSIGKLESIIEINNEDVIDVSSLANGIYYFKIYQKESIEVKKIIIFKP